MIEFFYVLFLFIRLCANAQLKLDTFGLGANTGINYLNTGNSYYNKVVSGISASVFLSI